eukprot:SAG31_NODE_187_length_20848_cov_22.521953_6_plen_290_part_00
MCPLCEKYGTFIARCNALIEKVSPCIRSDRSRDPGSAALVVCLAQALDDSPSKAAVDCCKFVDPHFPPQPCALGSDTYYDTIAGAHSIEWRRPGGIRGLPSRWSKHDRIDPVHLTTIEHVTGVGPHQRHDWRFHSALHFLSIKDDERLRSLILDEGNKVGLYGVRFFVSGTWKTVVIDDFFPCVAFLPDGGTSPSQQGMGRKETERRGCKSGRRDERLALWPLILEKGWAKLRGSYSAAYSCSAQVGHTAEEVLHCLTGGAVTRLDATVEPAWEQLKQLVRHLMFLNAP